MANGALPENSGGRRLTYADYKDWEPAKGERFELVQGEAWAMAGPNAYHQSISGELFRQIANYLVARPCKVFAAPFDVRLFYEEDESDDTVVQPDIIVICDEKKRGKEGCRGAPDFVAEILSPSNTAFEMEQKFELYREAGVKEYWVLDPAQKRLHAYRFDGGQILARSCSSHDAAPLEILEGLSITLESVFAE